MLVGDLECQSLKASETHNERGAFARRETSASGGVRAGAHDPVSVDAREKGERGKREGREGREREREGREREREGTREGERGNEGGRADTWDKKSRGNEREKDEERKELKKEAV